MVTILQKILLRREIIILALMLEILHFSIWLDFGNWISRSLMLVHLGLFLIWQPVWRRDEQISLFNSVLFIVLAFAFVSFLDWGLLFGWLIVLTGFTGGVILTNQQARNTYMVVLAFLTSELILECTPNLFQFPVSANVRYFFKIALPVLPVFFVLLPSSGKDIRLQSVDILHAIITSTLATLIIFGCLLNMSLSGAEYLISLIETLLTVALFLFTISWLLSPRTGFSGLSQLWTKSLLNIGTPFEQWLSGLSDLSQRQDDPEAFLEMAMEDLVSLPWIEGIVWRIGEVRHEYGKKTKYEAEFKTDNMTVWFHTNTSVGGALYLHCILLVRLLDNFYVAKLRERELTNRAHLQAIYETGARLTHDIKNLLQSLRAITSIIADDSNIDARQSARLLERQLPHLTQRLQLALDKLQAPAKTTTNKIRLQDWWRNLMKRNEEPDIEFRPEFTSDPLIPADLFDSVAENLLENIRDKARLETGLKTIITVRSQADEYLSLQVQDNGTSIPSMLAKDLLRGPVKSASGLGIGLYQAAQMAQSMGYTLELINNRDGAVCFELKNTSEPAVMASARR